MRKTALLSAAFLFLHLNVYCDTQTYTVQRRLSSLKFQVSAQLHTVHGVSQAFSGTISGDPSDITAAKIDVKVDPATFDTDNEKRDTVLREKCLEVTRFPAIEFVSTSISAGSRQLTEGKPLDATIKGTLKMHGLEKEISVPVKILLKGEELTAEGTMAVVLDDWQILRPKVLFVRLQNDVQISFTIGGHRNP